MNTHTHTLGPWHLGKRGGNPAIYGKDGTEVAEILHGLTPEWRDNARLIAAAPELLSAAVELRDFLQTLAGEVKIPSSLYLQGKRAMDAAELAFSKAKGGEA
jgi:hypothetical protein